MFYDKLQQLLNIYLQEAMNIEEFAFIMMGMIIMIILYIFLGKLLEHKHWHFLHQTGIGILLGLVFGLLASALEFMHQIQFSEEFFFYGLLPPMIFAGGYNLKKQNFGQNFKYILLFGLLGTITAFGVIFGITYFLNSQHLIIPLNSDSQYQVFQTNLIVKYSATISATDSVAALTLIDSMKFPKIFSIIFGQGMVNDAVAIILFKVVGGIFDDLQDHPMGGGEIAGKIIGNFFLTIIVSVGIGLISALLCAVIFKNMRFLVNSQITQVVITYLFGILSYVIAELFDMSGVITVLISGVMLAHYNFYNLTPGGMHATSVFFQFISVIAEAIVFVYLGISIVYYFQKQVFSLSFLGLQLLVCVLSRFVSIFGISMLFKLFNKKWTVTYKQLSVVSIAGTIRGSVAFALILTIEGDQHDKHQSDQVEIVKTTTLVMVCLTTIVLGALMPLFIKIFLGGKKEGEVESQASQQIQEKKEEKPKDKKKGFFGNFSEYKLKPFFIYKYAENKVYYKEMKKAMKANSKGDSQNQFDKLITVSVNHDLRRSEAGH